MSDDNVQELREYVKEVAMHEGLGNSAVEEFDRLIEEGADPQDAVEIVLSGIDDDSETGEYLEEEGSPYRNDEFWESRDDDDDDDDDDGYREEGE